jgi:hypothetical protein
MVGTYGCARADAAANYRMQNPMRSIGLSDRAAAARMHATGGPSASSRGVDSAAAEGLDRAAQSGHGITKPELQEVVRDVVERRGGSAPTDPLPASARRAIQAAVDDGAFARQSTAQLALQLAQGALSPAEVGAQIGRSK